MAELTFVLFLLAMGWLAGSIAQQRHFTQLNKREQENGSFLITQLKSFPAQVVGESPPQMIVAETVIASDYFKSFLATLRGLFGGEVRSFHSLLTRARRESTQRIVEQARDLGYNAICNLRIETADIGSNTNRRKGAAMVAILASATAYHYQAPSS